MVRRMVILTAAGALALTTGLAACGSTTSGSTSTSTADLPTVKLMVGGIDKQIYLPYQLAQSLGFYQKYGVNMELSTEQAGGVGAEDAVASGQVDMAGAWYVHTIDFQTHGKDVVDIEVLTASAGDGADGTPRVIDHIPEENLVLRPLHKAERPPERLAAGSAG